MNAGDYHAFALMPPIKQIAFEEEAEEGQSLTTAVPNNSRRSIHFDTTTNDFMAFTWTYRPTLNSTPTRPVTFTLDRVLVHFSPLVSQHQRQFNANNAEGATYSLRNERGTQALEFFRFCRRSPDRYRLAALVDWTEIAIYDLIDDVAGNRGSMNNTNMNDNHYKTPDMSAKCVITMKQGTLRFHKDHFIVRDVHWLTSETLMVITSAYMDLIKIIPPIRGSPANSARHLHLRRVYTTVDYHVFSPRHNLLLCVNREKRDIIKPYIVAGPSNDLGLRALEKLVVPTPEHHGEHGTPIPSNGACPPHPKDMKLYLSVITLYNLTFVVQVTPRQEILLYCYNTEATSFDRVLAVNVYDEGEIGIQIVDNLFVVHNLNKKLSFVYDVRGRLRTGGTLHPLCLPLRMRVVMKRDGEGGCMVAVNDDNHNSVCDLYNAVDCEYHNTRHTPFVFNKKQGKALLVGLNLNAMSNSLNAGNSLEFLLRRSASVPHILSHLSAIVADARTYSPNMISTAFATINVPYGEAVQRGITASPSPVGGVSTSNSMRIVRQLVQSEDHAAVFPTLGVENTVDCLPVPLSCTREPHEANRYQQVIDQMDVYRTIFCPMLDAINKAAAAGNTAVIVSKDRLTTSVVEYITSLVSQRVPLHELLQRFVLDLFILPTGAAGTSYPSSPSQYAFLQQLFMYRIIEDSEPVAMQLLTIERHYAPAFQLALDMLSRLKAFNVIVHVLLTRGEVLRALEVMVANAVLGVPLHLFFDRLAVRESEDPSGSAVDHDRVFVSAYELAAMYVRSVRGLMESSPNASPVSLQRDQQLSANDFFHEKDKCDWVVARYRRLTSHTAFARPRPSRQQMLARPRSATTKK